MDQVSTKVQLDLQNNLTWAYLAGIFDGEGTVAIEHRKDTDQYTVRCQIAQLSSVGTPLFQALTDQFGGYITIEDKHHKNPMSYWRLGIYSSKEFLEKILPYSLFKRQQIECALAFIDFKEDLTKEEQEKAKHYMHDLKRTKPAARG